MALGVVVGAVGAVPSVRAETLNSSHYKAVDTQFGSASSDQSCSGQYCAKVSIGDPTTSESSTAASTANFGPITPNEPTLDVIIEVGASNLGVLSTERTATKVTVLKVRNYLSSGYTVQIMGDPPKYANHSLLTPNTPTTSRPGTEQFAMNAVENSIPAIGANPKQITAGETGLGAASSEYGQSNQFKYQNGDIIIRSLKASGETQYTISMIINISNTTPAGHYSGDFSAVVVPVF